MVRSLSGLILAVIATPALSQVEQNLSWCSSHATDDQVIAGCSALIDSGYGDRIAQAIEHFNRGNAYENKQAYDLAIADYDQAIGLNPNYAYAFANRGIAYRRKQAFDRAIADYDQAIKLNPGYAMAFYNRALAYKAKQNYDRALADVEQFIRLDPSDPNGPTLRTEITALRGQ